MSSPLVISSPSGAENASRAGNPGGIGGPGGIGVGGAARSSKRRTGRWVMLAGGVVILAAVSTALSVPHGGLGRLDPTNAAPNGSRALVQILRRQGVDVRALSNSQQVVDATDTRTMLLVTNPGLLGHDQLERLAHDDVQDIVLVEPGELSLRWLDPQIHPSGVSGATDADPSCAVPAARTAGRARAGGVAYTSDNLTAGADTPLICYRTSDPGSGSYLVSYPFGRKVTVIGQSDLLTNEYLGQAGNAALALNTLGTEPTLIWYTPDPLEPSATPSQSLGDLLPDWVFWVIVQLAVVVMLVMLWRSRRLGRLVSEPLPVVVRAAETQEGRARLYRQSSARGRAAATLRTTTLRRLAGRLAAPSGTSPEQLVTMLASATGRDDVTLRTVLLGPAPSSDAALIALADDLDAVESDLTRST